MNLAFKIIRTSSSCRGNNACGKNANAAMARGTNKFKQNPRAEMAKSGKASLHLSAVRNKPDRLF